MRAIVAALLKDGVMIVIAGRATPGQASVRRLHVGFSLLTLFPGRVGGSETNVRGLLGEYAAGNGPERVTVLANRHVMQSYAGLERGPAALHHVRSYRPGDSDMTRVLAMQRARVMPGRAARDVPAGLDLVHFPVTVPIPRVDLPTVVTLFDVQHHDMPRPLRPRGAHASPLGLRRGRAQRRRAS